MKKILYCGILLCGLAQAALAQSRLQDSLALVDLYNATNGANWTTRTNWLSTNPINTWYGITTNAQGCVTRIAFVSNNLGGTLPNLNLTNLEYLQLGVGRLTGNIPNFNLPNLKYLYLYNNQLSGNIPNFNLPNLVQLILDNNQLIGSIPDFNLPNLELLNLNFNRLSGNMPNFNLPRLVGLHLSGNQLTGNIPNFNLPNLQAFYSGGNQLSGSIPSFTSDLRSIDLGYNQLSGNIPNFNLPNLRNLWLNNNQLNGTIPNFNFPNLNILYLNNNKLIGSIPINFQTFQSMERLHYHANKIDSTPNLSMLPLKVDTTYSRGLRSYSNKLTFDDILPNMGFATTATFIYAPQDSIFAATTYTRNAGQSLTIDLGIDGAITTNVYKWYKNGALFQTTNVNQLTFNSLALTDAGVYTCQVTNPNAPLLTLYSRKATMNVMGASCRTQDSLVLVDLYNATGGTNWTNRTNWLSANPINTWYGITTNAQGCVICIDLDGGANINCIGSPASPGNNLVGIVPNTIGNLSKLKTLILVRNQLSGNLPTSLGRLLEAQQIYLSYNQFTGTIPDSLGNLLNLLELELNDNQLTGSIPTALGNLRNLQELLLGNNKLSGNIPNFTFPALQNLWLNNNQFTGKVPIQFQNLTNLKYFYLHSNKIDSLPNLSMLANLTYFKADTLQITFDDILPNIARNILYAKQDFFFKDTTILKNVGQSFTINLGIDGALTTNVYKWYKNNTLYQTTNVNQLIINCLQSTDAGLYTCQVTNPSAPALTLQSRKITVMVNGNPNPPINAKICKGATYTLPRGRIVQLANTYYDTFRFPNRCDSIVTIYLSVVKPDTTRLRDSIVCFLRDTQTRVRHWTNKDNCDSTVIQRFRLAQRDTMIQTEIVCDTVAERTDTLYIRATNRCEEVSITRYVFKRCECLKETQIYNALIPNDNDVLNNVFWIHNLENFMPNELIITDKRNTLLYKVKDYKNDWTGNDQHGVPLPAGVYNYVFRMTNPRTGEKCLRVGVIDIKYIP